LFLKNLNPLRRVRELMEELRRTRRERDQARQQVEQLEDEKQRLHEKLERLREENERLRNELEAAMRAGKRQAAPFSRGKPKDKPKPPGRKSGKAHSTHHQRPIPDHVDEAIQVNAPAQCPDCGGPLTVERVESQYQEEIVRRTWVRRFHIPICRCDQCQKRVQGRHRISTWTIGGISFL
jgi:transposase